MRSIHCPWRCVKDSITHTSWRWICNACSFIHLFISSCLENIWDEEKLAEMHTWEFFLFVFSNGKTITLRNTNKTSWIVVLRLHSQRKESIRRKTLSNFFLLTVTLRSLRRANEFFFDFATCVILTHASHFYTVQPNLQFSGFEVNCLFGIIIFSTSTKNPQLTFRFKR